MGQSNSSGSITVFCSSKKSKNGPKKKGKPESQLKLSVIKGLYLGFIPLVSKTLHQFTASETIMKIRKALPHQLTAKRFVHACAFLITEKLADGDYDGILVEYGAYTRGRDSDYDREVYFLNFEGESGLRYTEMTLKEFKENMQEANTIEDEKTKKKELINLPYLECRVNSVNLFHMLIERIIFGEDYKKNPTKCFYTVFSNEEARQKYFKTYKGENYSLLKYNCQNFVNKLIEASYATLIPDMKIEIINNQLCFCIEKIDYKNLNYYVPPCIAEALEKNEKIITQRLKEGKPRIVENNFLNFYDWNNFTEALDEAKKNLELEIEKTQSKKDK